MQLERKVVWCIPFCLGLGLACGDDLSSAEGDPDECIGGEFCVGDLICVDGFCVEPGAETSGDGDSGDGDGDGDPGDGDGDPGSCGDGLIDPGEECDDGNDDDTDTCLSSCVAASCGDGFVGPGESCDDGNDVDDDECTNTCALASCGDGEVQAGEDCDDANADDSDACLSTCVAASCGDGEIWADNEECDDGNALDGDACLNSCADASCGDGVLYDGIEECDDGNAVNTDACVEGCIPAVCGDGFVEAGVEECDDQNNINTDTCVQGCALASCGDGFVGPGEGCDDGNNINDDACSNACALASCGDGNVQQGEACDDGNNNNNDACLNTCVAASCGDGYLFANVEDCDDANPDNTDACLNTCDDAGCGDGFVWAGNEDCDDQNNDDDDACVAGCVAASCGDGFVYQGVEECDDQNGLNSDGCVAGCVVASCGDGYTWAGNEDCDDGNNNNNDACVGDTCQDASCGDSYIWAGNETCDDGNMVSYDGCETSCETTEIIDIVSGAGHNCVLFEGGGVRCWGSNSYGQLGLGHANNIGDNPNEMPPALANVGGPVAALGAAGSTTCALMENGDVRCWGQGDYGEIGHESTVDIGDTPGELPPPIIDVGPGVVTALVGGRHMMCARFEGGAMRCWGANEYGQLGQGHTMNLGASANTMPPPNINVGGPVAAMAPGVLHTCVLLESGAVRCWGRFAGYANENNVTLGDEPNEMPPPDVDFGTGNVTSISTGANNGCVTLDNQKLRCWGSSDFGKNGWGALINIGAQPNDMPPPDVDFGLGNPLQVITGYYSTRVLVAGGNVRNWGSNANDNLGYPDWVGNYGDQPNEMPPPNVDLGGGVVVKISAGTDARHVCALFDDSTVRCWGPGSAGRLGNGSTQNIGDDPEDMPPPPAILF